MKNNCWSRLASAPSHSKSGTRKFAMVTSSESLTKISRFVNWIMINCPALCSQIILTKVVGLEERLPHSGICIRLSSSVADPGCFSRIRICSITDPWSRVKKIPGSGSASKNLSILTQNLVYKLSEIWSEMFIPDPDPRSIRIFIFYPSLTPDPVVKKAPVLFRFLHYYSNVTQSVYWVVRKGCR